MNPLGKRIAQLEGRTPVRHGLDSLATTELLALQEALHEEDATVRAAKLAGLNLRPESDRALTRYIANLTEERRE